MAGESPNDRNDRGTLVAPLGWLYLISSYSVDIFMYPLLLTGHIFPIQQSVLLLVGTKLNLGDSAKVLLVTNDRDNKRKATEEGLNAETGAIWIFCYIKLTAEPFTMLN